MKKPSEADIINKMDEMLIDVIRHIHAVVTEGGFEQFVYVDQDSERFCKKAIQDISIVKPYYFREYIEKAHDTKSSAFSFRKLAYVYIKSIMHVRMFSPNRAAIHDFLEQGNELDFKISYPSSYAATWLVYMAYKWLSVTRTELTPFFDYAHCVGICESLCELLEHNKSNLTDITPGLASFVLHALELSHKDVTARTTHQLLARDALIPLIESWAVDLNKIGLLHFDIDYFSQVNNDNDHKTGDECLRQIAAKVYDFCKVNKGACERHGGEEFIIAFPFTSELDFPAIAESLLSSIREVKRPNHDKSDPNKYKPNMSATISYGVMEVSDFTHDSFIMAYGKALHLLDEAVVDSKKNDKRNTVIHVEAFI